MDETLVLTRSDVVELRSLHECIVAVERAFRLHAEGASLPPDVLSVPATDGGFHIKAAGLQLVDHLGQCATIGEPYHALDAGLMTRADVRAELSDVAVGQRHGRATQEAIVIFDSTGTTRQDVAAAAAVYARARATGRGLTVALGA